MGVVPSGGTSAGPKVVVIGGGYERVPRPPSTACGLGGCQVTLVRPNATCCLLPHIEPGAGRQQDHGHHHPDSLARRHGVRVVQDRAVRCVDKRQSDLASGTVLPYDRLIVSPGVWTYVGDVAQHGQTGAARQNCQLESRPSPQTVALRQLEAMPTAVCMCWPSRWHPTAARPGRMSAPASGALLQRAKPRNEVIIADANDDVTSQGPLFKSLGRPLQGIINTATKPGGFGWTPQPARSKFEFGDDQSAVLNVIHPCTGR